MAIYLTGDTHGDHSIRKLNKRKFDIGSTLTREDYVIILGDFGLVWGGNYKGCDRWWLDWLEDKPWTTLFIDGNHENFDLLSTYPEERWNGGKTHVIRDHVRHLCRGEVFNLSDKTIFTLGGAYSHDKEYRKENRTWWAEEVPSTTERIHAIETLNSLDAPPDAILTHEPPAQAHVLLEGTHPSEFSDWLHRAIYSKYPNTPWFFGHLHKDVVLRPLQPYTAVYHKIIRLNDDDDGFEIVN